MKLHIGNTPNYIKEMNKMNINRLSKVLKFCCERYDVQTYLHCVRVANYAIENPTLYIEEEKEDIYILAMFHDLLEDTDVTYEKLIEISGMSEEFLKAQLGVLTKDKNESYIDYIKRLKESGYRWAYIVKLADMKDHLTQKETLTDKLKEKYWEALSELL